MRVGFAGPPGAGKSSLIEGEWGNSVAIGMQVVEGSGRVAVLAVDPSSKASGGSILGDKTRMTRLAFHANAYVRATPTRGVLGGVARNTADAILLCEAAGYETVIVETVGVGQSEDAVADLTDLMVVESYVCSAGIVEVADILVVNKADDATHKLEVNRMVHEYSQALRHMRPRSRAWAPKVLACSARTGMGVEAVWQTAKDCHAALAESSELARRRAQQRRSQMWAAVQALIADR
eukprot:jgi/Chlat1/7257/Chrsp58S06872